MTIEPVASLHLVAHRAASAPRNVEDWWGSPFDTALAAVAASRHSSVYREDAERALERLLRWRRDGDPRPISADVVALALMARAAAELQRGDPQLVAEAAAALGELAERDPEIVPLLHLTLGAWALDRLVPNREDAPWPALRARLERSVPRGIDEPLRALAVAIAAPAFDASSLVQNLLSDVGTSPGLTEATLLLFVLSAALERVSEQLASTDSGLQVLCRRRAELVERLATEVGEQTFTEPAIPDFNGEVELDLGVIAYLSAGEALLLDLALASREPATPWLEFAEAERLFGERERQERSSHDESRRRGRRVAGALLGIASVAIGASVGQALVLAGLTVGVAVDLAVTVAASGLVFASAFWRAATDVPRLAAATGKFFMLLVPLTALAAANQLTNKPFLSSASDLVVSLVLAAIVAVGWELVLSLTSQPDDASK